ncbi:uncharacterized protein LACBIDRAFT_335491 [Laccaria bicolor S238N-H82]|uniref:Predicted protein n=1 Tax=Laccaria bicolor (strain S238N-H82 / ATCC MYA-4686) TaxID=486041 RepID=B0E2F5_LACBS|nr:uncharacterized protein LACBIDRAFT_335491 [Laccaria bicolor S238N-H82]EDQ98986.1 predicted protein [Laccaria bicolor S238N-H82]|eukprot:XP_001890388.1 predicted protein [Laccaria bicolor S238N-H82]
MAKLPNDGAPIGSPSSVGDLEDVLARLSITSEVAALDDNQLSDTSAASIISLSDFGDSENPTPASSTTLVATTPLNVVSLTPVVAAAPIAIASPNLAAPTANAVGVQAAVVAGATPVAAPLYNTLPVNAPANATLPPAHLHALPYGYHVPAANAEGPFYVVTCGRNVGVFNGWENTSPLVTGVSHAVFSRVASMAEGHARMNAAITSTLHCI